MKVFAISDLHLSINNPKPMDIFGPAWEGYLENIFSEWNEKVKEDDLVLLAGDFSWAMKLEDAIADFELLKNLKGKKVIIRGNHDYWWKSISAVRNILPRDFYAIQNDAIKFNDVIVCGTRSWSLPDPKKPQTEEDKKIFARELIRLELTLQAAKKLQTNNEEIICMLHYPPYDQVRSDTEVTEMLEKYGVKKVVFGHLHAYRKIPLFFKNNGVEYYLTSCDLTKNHLTLIKDEF